MKITAKRITKPYNRKARSGVEFTITSKGNPPYVLFLWNDEVNSYQPLLTLKKAIKTIRSILKLRRKRIKGLKAFLKENYTTTINGAWYLNHRLDATGPSGGA